MDFRFAPFPEPTDLPSSDGVARPAGARSAGLLGGVPASGLPDRVAFLLLIFGGKIIFNFKLCFMAGTFARRCKPGLEEGVDE